jgi:tyrosyl-tRNA synthetase
MIVEPGTYTAYALVQRFFAGQMSNSAIRRLFQQGAISLNAQGIGQPEQNVEAQDGDVLRVGKRTWLRIRVQ